jgi:MFS family permease
VVGGAFLCMLAGYAVAYSFAAFFSALESEFGARRGETAPVFSISAFLYFQMGLPAGMIADRTGPRPVVIGGLLLVAAGLVMAAQAGALLMSFGLFVPWRVRSHRPLARRRRFRRPRLGIGDRRALQRGRQRRLLVSPVAGYSFDFFGSYTGAILAGAALCLVSFVMTLAMPEPRQCLARQRQPH